MVSAAANPFAWPSDSPSSSSPSRLKVAPWFKKKANTPSSAKPMPIPRRRQPRFRPKKRAKYQAILDRLECVAVGSPPLWWWP